METVETTGRARIVDTTEYYATKFFTVITIQGLSIWSLKIWIFFFS
jgi:hypothetical protein